MACEPTCSREQSSGVAQGRHLPYRCAGAFSIDPDRDRPSAIAPSQRAADRRSAGRPEARRRAAPGLLGRWQGLALRSRPRRTGLLHRPARSSQNGQPGRERSPRSCSPAQMRSLARAGAAATARCPGRATCLSSVRRDDVGESLGQRETTVHDRLRQLARPCAPDGGRHAGQPRQLNITPRLCGTRGRSGAGSG